MVARLRRRLDDGRIARDQRGGGHAGADGQGEIPGTDDGGHAAGLIRLMVQLAHETAQSLWLEQANGNPGIVLAEVDGLADVGIGLAPGLASLANHYGGQFVPAPPHRGSGSNEDLRAIQGLAIAPGRKGLGSRSDRIPTSVRADGQDPWHGDLGNGFRKPLPLAFIGEITPRLIDHRQIAAKSGDRG